MYNYFKILVEENISQEFRLKKNNKTRIYFLEEINYIEHSLILTSAVTRGISISVKRASSRRIMLLSKFPVWQEANGLLSVRANMMERPYKNNKMKCNLIVQALILNIEP